MRTIRGSHSLTDRDQRILVFLFRSKILSLQQIQRYFFHEGRTVLASRRMGMLWKYGLVNKERVYKEGKELRAYSITDLGLRAIASNLSFEVDSTNFYSSSHLHDLELAGLSRIFSQLEVVEKIFSESELMSCSELHVDSDLSSFVSLRTDRVLLINGLQGRNFIALEYERSLKNKNRNSEKLNDYYLHGNVPVVLYICENEKILRSLSDIDSKICEPSESKMYFCLKEKIIRTPEKITFKRSDGHSLYFR